MKRVYLTKPCLLMLLEHNYQRGPPKGYIRALEQRLQLAESILGSVIASEDPASRSLVNNLRRDPIAHSIVDRVSHGIYGVNVGAAPEESESSILTSRTTSQHARDLGGRTTRETRTEREAQVMSHRFGTSLPFQHLIILDFLRSLFFKDDLQPPPDWQSNLLAILNDDKKVGRSPLP